jgi:hypothetical protein
MGQGSLAIKRREDQSPEPQEYPGVAGQYLIGKPHQGSRLTNAPMFARLQFNS